MPLPGLPPLAAWLLVSVSVALAGPAASEKGASFTDLPQTIDPARRYLFYMHGAWIEQGDPDREHPRHGRYRYDDIVRAFADEGFVVVSEARRGNTRVPRYAEKVTRQVRRLLEAGVAPDRITVVGHSKGGNMVLLVAASLQESGVGFVVMAGCGKKGNRFGDHFEEFVATRASRLRGRILSLYDQDDRIAGSCLAAFQRAPQLESKEVVLRTGKGHGLFYAPERVWIDPVLGWAGP